MGGQKSDRCIVAMKLVKAGGAKAATNNRFCLEAARCHRRALEMEKEAAGIRFQSEDDELRIANKSS